MIGGCDIQISTHAETDGLDVALRLCRRLWPNAVFEDVSTGSRHRDLTQLALDQVEEILVYRDHAAALRWDDCGAIPELNGTLIHLILRKGLLTLTLDDEPNEQLIGYADSVKKALRQPLFNVIASSSRAAA